MDCPKRYYDHNDCLEHQWFVTIHHRHNILKRGVDMYLTINNQNYPLRRRRLTDQSVTYFGMTDMPETVSGTITMYRDDGFEMSTDDADSYARQVKGGTVLVLTNEPEPPEPPEPQISDDEAVAIITDTLTTSEALNIITGGTT